MNEVLNIENIRKSFAINYIGRASTLGTEYKNVINGLTLTLNRGEVTSLVGGNGAGKTSLFNLISGLLRPDSGKIIFTGSKAEIDCCTTSPWRIARAGIGRGFQGTRIFGELSVMEHLMLQATPSRLEVQFNKLFISQSRQKHKDIEDRIRHELSPFSEFDDMLKYIRKPASSLSYAKQRLLSMAGLMIGDYDLLLLDEPSSGLSLDSLDVIYAMIALMKEKGKSIFLIEHNMEFVRKSSDICHYMSAGEIKFSGTPEEVLNNQIVQESYLL